MIFVFKAKKFKEILLEGLVVLRCFSSVLSGSDIYVICRLGGPYSKKLCLRS